MWNKAQRGKTPAPQPERPGDRALPAAATRAAEAAEPQCGHWTGPAAPGPRAPARGPGRLCAPAGPSALAASGASSRPQGGRGGHRTAGPGLRIPTRAATGPHPPPTRAHRCVQPCRSQRCGPSAREPRGSGSGEPGRRRGPGERCNQQAALGRARRRARGCSGAAWEA